MKQKNLVLMAIAVGCGLVAAILTSQMGKEKPVEEVDMIVAAKDMTTGTAFTKDNIETLTMVKKFPKNAINPEAKVIMDPKELIGKRLTRATHAGEFFNVADVNNKTQIMFESGRDIMSLPMNAAKAAAGFVGPGARVDIVGSVIEGTRREVFTLLADMHVLAVNGEQDLTKQQIFPDMSMVSFSVTEAQAKLITLANQRNCNLELLLRHPDAPKRYPTAKEEEAAYQKTLSMLKNLGNPTEIDPGKTKPDVPEEKIEEVEVYVAKEDIKAPVEITKEFIDEKFTRVKKPKKSVEGAVTDAAPYLPDPGAAPFKMLTLDVLKDSYLLVRTIGKLETIVKPKPQDPVVIDLPKPPEPKPGETPPPPPEIAPWPHAYVPPKPPEPRTRDIAQHSQKGTIVYRYQETGVDTNEWKLIAILSPMEAATKPDKKAD